MKKLFGLMLALLLLAATSANALAQEEPAMASVPSDTVRDDTRLQETWGQKRVIRTLQRRLFDKFGRMEFTFFAGIVPNDPFVFYTPIGLRFDYHFNEAFAVELSGAFQGCFTGEVKDGERGPGQGCLRFPSSLRDDLAVDKRERTQVDSIDLLYQQAARVDLLAMWSPIFGKVAAMNDSLAHFDVNVVGGAGVLFTDHASDIDPRTAEFQTPTVEGVVGAGFKFYFGGRFAVRADFRQFIYINPTTKTVSGERGGDLVTPSEITLGFSVFTDPL